MKPTMMPPSMPMSTPTAPALGAMGGAPSAAAMPPPIVQNAAKPKPSRFNPDNALPKAAFHKPGR